MGNAAAQRKAAATFALHVSLEHDAAVHLQVLRGVLERTPVLLARLEHDTTVRLQVLRGELERTPVLFGLSEAYTSRPLSCLTASSAASLLRYRTWSMTETVHHSINLTANWMCVVKVLRDQTWLFSLRVDGVRAGTSGSLTGGTTGRRPT